MRIFTFLESKRNGYTTNGFDTWRPKVIIEMHIGKRHILIKVIRLFLHRLTGKESTGSQKDDQCFLHGYSIFYDLSIIRIRSYFQFIQSARPLILTGPKCHFHFIFALCPFHRNREYIVHISQIKSSVQTDRT